MTDLVSVFGPFLTVVATIFVMELTDKDAILLFSLAASKSVRLVFAAGSMAFAITSAVIVLLGTALVSYVPILWVKLAGGSVMLGYAVWSFAKAARVEGTKERTEKKVLERGGDRELYAFFAIVASLALLDLTGDATELVTIVFVAQYQNALLVFLGAVVALVVASGLEAILGNRLGRVLAVQGWKYLPAIILLVVGAAIVATSLFGI